MTTPALLATYLSDAMSARRMPLEEFEHELGHIRREDIQSWLDGWSSPDLDHVPSIARALRREPVEVATAWLVDRLPELHAPFYAEVLEPRGSAFPHPSDLTVRARLPRRTKVERMDVGDPHDVRRSARGTVPKPAGKLRKRPPVRSLATASAGA